MPISVRYNNDRNREMGPEKLALMTEALAKFPPDSPLMRFFNHIARNKGAPDSPPQTTEQAAYHLIDTAIMTVDSKEYKDAKAKGDNHGMAEAFIQRCGNLEFWALMDNADDKTTRVTRVSAQNRSAIAGTLGLAALTVALHTGDRAWADLKGAQQIENNVRARQVEYDKMSDFQKSWVQGEIETKKEDAMRGGAYTLLAVCAGALAALVGWYDASSTQEAMGKKLDEILRQLNGSLGEFLEKRKLAGKSPA